MVLGLTFYLNLSIFQILQDAPVKNPDNFRRNRPCRTRSQMVLVWNTQPDSAYSCLAQVTTRFFDPRPANAWSKNPVKKCDDSKYRYKQER